LKALMGVLKDDYLAGTFTLSATGRSGGSNERPIDLQKKK
jgi:hypothetical protein